MLSRLRILLALLMSLAFVAAACGGDDAASTSSDADASAEDGDGSSEGGDRTPTASAQKTLAEECQENSGIEAADDFNVVLVTDIGKVDDGTFNEFAFNGLKGAEDCWGIEISYIETVSEADYAANLATALESDPEVVVSVGFLLASDTMAAAQDNPDVSFIGVDQFHPEYPDNYIGVLFNEHEGGYIVGALAAAMSETGVIGVVAGREDVPPVVKFVNGYIQGAKATNSDISVLSVYNESFTDPAKGGSDAEQFIGEGADVVFGAGGPTGSGAVAKAAEAGVWAIGVDQDEYFTTFAGGEAAGANYLISSAMKRVDLGVIRNIQAAIEGTFAGGAYVLSAENDGITYAPFHEAGVSQDAALTVEAARAGLAGGTISTGVCFIDGILEGEGSACD